MEKITNKNGKLCNTSQGKLQKWVVNRQQRNKNTNRDIAKAGYIFNKTIDICSNYIACIVYFVQ